MADRAESVTGTTVFSLLRDPKNPVAWERFVAKYGPKIHRWCRSFGLSEQQAEDVTQELVLRLLRGIVTYRWEKGRFRSWLKTAAAKTTATFLAKEARARGPRTDEELRHLLDRNPNAARQLDNVIEEIETEELLQVACENVQGEFESATWSAFERQAREKVPATVVATELKMTTGAVYQAVYRVRQRLKEEIQRLRGDES